MADEDFGKKRQVIIGDLIVLQKLLENVKSDDILALGTDSEMVESLTKTLVRLYRMNQSSDSTELILNQNDQLICVQLCLAEINKQETGEFDVEMSTVLDYFQQLLAHKLSSDDVTTDVNDEKFSLLLESYQKFVKRCKCVDMIDVLNGIKARAVRIPENVIFVTRKPPTRVEELALEFFCQDRPIQFAECNDVTEISYRSCSSLAEGLSRLTPICPSSPVSITEDHVRGIFLSYLQLLVNSRSELSLARVFNVPDRELGDRAFTDLRKVAVTKNLSMCQTVISHVMKLRLGGKSYRPDTCCPLTHHIKGLSELVDLLHKLQTIMEEEYETRQAVERLLRTICTALFRCKSNRIKRETIEKVSNQLEISANQAVDGIVTGVQGPTPDKKSSDGGSARGRHTLCILRHLLDLDAVRPCDNGTGAPSVVNVLSDTFSTQRTPLRFPSIMSKFRSPEVLEDLPEEELNQPLSFRLGLSQKQNPKAAVPRQTSSMDWADPSLMMKKQDDHIFSEEEIRLLNKTSALSMQTSTNLVPTTTPRKPSKLVRVPQESRHDQENVLCKVTSPKRAKRKAKQDGGTDDLAIEPAQKRAKKIPAKKIPAKKSGKVKSVKDMGKGQKRLTDFFRM